MDQEQMVSAVLQAVQALPQDRQPLIVALDGRCASGKTTLAALLQQQTGCSVVHMDHFFLRPEQRTRERLEQPGGNVDYERFLAEVLEPLRAGKDCSYRPYDCKQQKLAEPVAVRQRQADCGGGLLQLPPDTLGAVRPARLFDGQSAGAAAPNRAAQRPAGTGDVPAAVDSAGGAILLRLPGGGTL